MDAVGKSVKHSSEFRMKRFVKILECYTKVEEEYKKKEAIMATESWGRECAARKIKKKKMSQVAGVTGHKNTHRWWAPALLSC